MESPTSSVHLRLATAVYGKMRGCVLGMKPTTLCPDFVTWDFDEK